MLRKVWHHWDQSTLTRVPAASTQRGQQAAPEPGQPAINRWPPGRGRGESRTLGMHQLSAVLPLRGGVLSEDSDQAVSLLLKQPSPSSCEYNFIYRPIFIHLSTSGRWMVGARTLTLQNDFFSFLPNLLGCTQDILHLDGRAFPPHPCQSGHS